MGEGCSTAGLPGVTEVIIGEGGSGATGERAATLMVRERRTGGWGVVMWVSQGQRGELETQKSPGYLTSDPMTSSTSNTERAQKQGQSDF